MLNYSSINIQFLLTVYAHYHSLPIPWVMLISTLHLQLSDREAAPDAAESERSASLAFRGLIYFSWSVRFFRVCVWHHAFAASFKNCSVSTRASHFWQEKRYRWANLWPGDSNVLFQNENKLVSPAPPPAQINMVLISQDTFLELQGSREGSDISPLGL